MKPFRGVCAIAFALVASAACANANLVINVDKSTQRMTVMVDGVPRYEFAVSTGRAGYGTPSGRYRPQRLERTWFSRAYYNSPMPHSIFFHGGYAIHGSYEIHRLGGPASHGCIRLHPANAATLFALVQREGAGNTEIIVSASNPSSHREVRQARTRAPAPAYDSRPGWYGGSYGYPYGQPYYNPYSRSW
jgi:L,D-transpeptidase catalytic domain